MVAGVKVSLRHSPRARMYPPPPSRASDNQPQIFTSVPRIFLFSYPGHPYTLRGCLQAEVADKLDRDARDRMLNGVGDVILSVVEGLVTSLSRKGG